MKKIKVKIGDNEYEVDVEELNNNELKIILENEEHIVKVSEETENKNTQNLEQHKTIKAPMPGIVSQILVKVGDQVEKDATLLTLLAMKMENNVIAERNGIVKKIKVKKNDNVNSGDILVVLE